jgi:hypothetical protein
MIGTFNYRGPVPTTEPRNAPTAFSEFALQPPQIRREVTARSRCVTGLEPVDMEASFAGGVRVRLGYEQGARWLMWVSSGGRWNRRTDFASPHAEHACRTAEQWYGPSIEGWNAVSEQ